MELLLKRLDELEKRIAILESGHTMDSKPNEMNDFKDTIKLIKINNEHLLNIFNSSVMDELIKIIIEMNSTHPFLQYKKFVFKLENNILTKMEDSDYKYLFEYIIWDSSSVKLIPEPIVKSLDGCIFLLKNLLNAKFTSHPPFL